LQQGALPAQDWPQAKHSQGEQGWQEQGWPPNATDASQGQGGSQLSQGPDSLHGGASGEQGSLHGNSGREGASQGQQPINESGQFAAGIAPAQLLNTYILAPTGRGFMLVHQQLAHERILYEQYTQAMQGQPIAMQQSLFPATLTLAPADAVLLQELLPHLQQLGYQVEVFGKDSFIVQGVPADVLQGNEKNAIEGLLEQYKHSNTEMKLSAREKLVRAAARQSAVKPGVMLTQQEMQGMLQLLFSCSQPNISPAGSPTYLEFKREYLEKMFGR
jgi:DNA mismatch repair protein MutL